MPLGLVIRWQLLCKGLTQSPLKLMEKPSVTPMDQMNNLPSTLTLSRDVEQDDDAVLQPMEAWVLCSACSPVTSHGDAEHRSQDSCRLPALGSQCKDNYRWFPNHSSKTGQHCELWLGFPGCSHFLENKVFSNSRIMKEKRIQEKTTGYSCAVITKMLKAPWDLETAL